MIQIIGGIVVLGAIGGLWQLKELLDKKHGREKSKTR